MKIIVSLDIIQYGRDITNSKKYIWRYQKIYDKKDKDIDNDNNNNIDADSYYDPRKIIHHYNFEVYNVIKEKEKNGSKKEQDQINEIEARNKMKIKNGCVPADIANK